MPPASVYMESQLENATPSTYYKRGGNGDNDPATRQIESRRFYVKFDVVTTTAQRGCHVYELIYSSGNNIFMNDVFEEYVIGINRGFWRPRESFITSKSENNCQQ